MTITVSEKPVHGMAVVEQILNSRTHLPPLVGHQRNIGAFLPEYLLGVTDCTKDDPLTAAFNSGWQCLIYDAVKPPCLVQLALVSGALEYNGLRYGILADRLLKAAQTAEKRLAASAVDYQPRLLSVPALRLNFLWLHGGDGVDKFICLTGGPGKGNFRPKLVDDIKPFFISGIRPAQNLAY